MFTIVGLGNPDEEYEGTRHNVGRDVLRAITKKEGTLEWKEDKKLRALVAKGELYGEKVLCVLPETLMNNSGGSLKPLAFPKPTKKRPYLPLVVLHDDLDLPLGVVKMSMGRGSGGHKGVESIYKALKTRDLVRIRIGISGATPSGKLKKPHGEAQVIDFVLGNFRAPEQENLKKVRATIARGLELLLTEGLDK
ncbi:MAG TPA: aminoacyl-tRNA hydrolase, partial [Candidatus Paceibacterota bacterium]